MPWPYLFTCLERLVNAKRRKKHAHIHTHRRDNVLLLRACVRNREPALKGEKKKCSAGRKNIIAKQTGREEWVIGNLTLCLSRPGFSRENEKRPPAPTYLCERAFFVGFVVFFLLLLFSNFILSLLMFSRVGEIICLL